MCKYIVYIYIYIYIINIISDNSCRRILVITNAIVTAIDIYAYVNICIRTLLYIYIYIYIYYRITSINRGVKGILAINSKSAII